MCIVLQVKNSLDTKGHFLDFIQDTKYQFFTFSLSDNDINIDISWSNTMQSRDMARDMKVCKREGNRGMNTTIHGNGLGLEEGTILPHQTSCVQPVSNEIV